MTVEWIILYAAWVIIIGLLFWLVPRDKIRHAQVIFFFKQFITWIVGLYVVQRGMIEYPVRLFNRATTTSFTFEYFAYPALCVFFNLYYPYGKSLLRQGLHYVIFCTGITIIEVMIEHQTELINYITWTWYYTWITLFLTFLASNLYYRWFFKPIIIVRTPKEEGP